MLTKTPKGEESKFSVALNNFENATRELEEICSEKNYDLSSCRKAIEKVNLKCINYHYTLDEIERVYGGIPMEQAERYILDLNKCLRVMASLGKIDPSVYGFMQQMVGRKELVSEKFKVY